MVFVLLLSLLCISSVYGSIKPPETGWIYAPWRFAGRPILTEGPQKKTNECTFCTQFGAGDDAKHFIIQRFKHALVMLNLYPYTMGHLLIVPYEHYSSLEDFSREARVEFMELVTGSYRILSEHLGAQGVNIGINMGEISGASIPGHLHIHVLPRRRGDTNFMLMLAQTQVISCDMHEIYQRLKGPFTLLAEQLA